MDGELTGINIATMWWVLRLVILVTGTVVLVACGGGSEVTGSATFAQRVTAQEAADAAFAHLEQEEFSAAVAAYDQALAIDPAYPEARFNRAAAHFELANYQAAIHDFDQVITQDPAHAESYYLRAAAYMLLDQIERSIDGFGRAVALDPGHSSAHFSRAFAYIKLGRDAEAEPDIDWLVKVLGVDEAIVRERLYLMINSSP